MVWRGSKDIAPSGAPPPFVLCGGEFFRGLAKLGRTRVARTRLLYLRPREAGEGDHAKRGGGGLGAETSREADAPSTALTRGPPSPLRGAG